MANDAADHARKMFEALGLDLEDDPELGETPDRYTAFLEQVFTVPDEDPPEMSTFSATSEADASGTEPVVLADLPFFSMCIHHVVPFFGAIDVGYVPDETMTGFGSVGRVIDYYARQPQLQERLVEQLADHIWEALSPRGLLVRCRARQMCMEMRGAEKSGRTVATASRGMLTSGEVRRDVIETFRAEQSS